MNVLIEMTTLSLSRPTTDTPVEVVAAWYRSTARLHEHMAGQSGVDSAEALSAAAAANEHALALVRHATTSATEGTRHRSRKLECIHVRPAPEKPRS